MLTGEKRTRLVALATGFLLIALGGYAVWLRGSSPRQTRAEGASGSRVLGRTTGGGSLEGLPDRARAEYVGTRHNQRTRWAEAMPRGKGASISRNHARADESPLDLDFNLSLEAQDRFGLNDEEFGRLETLIDQLKRTVADEERRVMWDENQPGTAGVTLHIPAWNRDHLAMEREFLADLGGILGEKEAQSFLQASRDALMLSSGYLGAYPRRYDIRLISSRSGSTSYVARVTAGANITDAGTLESAAEALGPDGVMQTRHFAELPEPWSHLFQAPAGDR